MTMKWQGPKLPPGVSASPKVKVDGSVTWYFYHKPTKTRLLQEPGTPAFEREVQRAASGQGQAIVAKPETLSDICDLFEKSPEHRRTSATTRLARERRLKLIRDRWGEYENRHLSDRRFRGEIFDWRDEMAATPAMADKSVQTLQRLISWAYNRGKVDYDHTKRIELLAEKRPREGKGIGPGPEAALLATGAPDEIRLYRFARMTGIRKSDLCRLKWTDIDAEGWLEWRHSKTRDTTKATSYYPTFALPALKKLLDETPRINEFIFNTHTGTPWTAVNIDQRWFAWRIRAGVVGDDIHFHDTRRQCIQDLLEADCTNAQAASISGHTIADSSDGSFEVYTQRCRRLALSAYRKLAVFLRPAPTDKKIVHLRPK